MTCRCIAQTLRSFILTVADFDVSMAKFGSRVHFSNHSYLTLVPRLGPLPNIKRLPRRAYLHTHRRLNKECRQKDENQIYTNSTNVVEEISNEINCEKSDAIVEFSPDAIDQLAQELHENRLNKCVLSSTALGQDGVDIAEKIQLEEDLVKTPLMDLMENMSQDAASSLVDSRSIKGERGLIKSLSRVGFSESKMKRVEESKPPPKEPWMIEKERLKQKYPNGYSPLKKLSPDAMEGIRALHAQMPEHFTTARLAQEFKVSPEAIRRILKSKWKPTIDEAQERELRWFKRGGQIWSRWAELGATPPNRFRRLGIGEKPPRPRYEPDPLPKLITTSTRRRNRDTERSGSGFKGGGIL